jgi:hypothetical protein
MECNGKIQTLLEALASALVTDSSGKVHLNLELLQSDCSELTQFINCENNHIPPEDQIKQIAGEDNCGNPVLRVISSLGSNINTESIQFDLNPDEVPAVGKMMWSADKGTLEVGLLGGDVTLQIGQETVIYCFNHTGAIIPNGSVVYIIDAGDSKPRISLADADIYAASFVLGVTTENIGINEMGYVTMEGLVHDVNTNGTTEGIPIWLSQTPGEFTTNRPTPPAMSIFIGYTIYAHAQHGIIVVRPVLVPRLVGLSDTYGTTATSGQFYKWNETNKRFEFRTDWDDLPPVPIIGARLGATAPTLTTFISDIQQYTFDASDDFVIGATEITHGWKEGTVIYPHIHWATNGLEATAKGVQWQLKYCIGDSAEAFSSQVTCVIDATIPANTTDRTHYVSNFAPTINGANYRIGAYIVWRLARIATTHANGEPAANPFALAVGFHVEQDTLESSQISTK